MITTLTFQSGNIFEVQKDLIKFGYKIHARGNVNGELVFQVSL